MHSLLNRLAAFTPLIFFLSTRCAASPNLTSLFPNSQGELIQYFLTPFPGAPSDSAAAAANLSIRKITGCIPTPEPKIPPSSSAPPSWKEGSAGSSEGGSLEGWCRLGLVALRKLRGAGFVLGHILDGRC